METTESTTKTKKQKPSGTPPSKPNENSSSSSNADANSNSSAGTNSGSTNSDESATAPEQMDGEMPEMPACEEGDEDCEMPEMPEDMQGGPGGRPGEMSMPGSDMANTWHPAAYLGIGAGSVILSLVVMYACFSNFFHKKPTAVFDKWQKFAIFCGAVLVLAAAICVLGYFIPEWIS